MGKTSLFLRYCNNSFNEAHNSTIQASFHNRRLNIDGKRVILNIWVRVIHLISSTNSDRTQLDRSGSTFRYKRSLILE